MIISCSARYVGEKGVELGKKGVEKGVEVGKKMGEAIKEKVKSEKE